MCRWLVYVGESTLAANLMFRADHSLIDQSESAPYTPGVPLTSKPRNHAVNVHGHGLGWYPAPSCTGVTALEGLPIHQVPAVYNGVHAASHDRNLRRLAEATETGLLFAHIRAAAPGAAVHEYNCHPFCEGRYMFMHNGGIARWGEIRRRVESTLSDEAYLRIKGSSDTEVAFNIFLDQLPDTCSRQPAAVLQQAMLKMIRVIETATGAWEDEQNPECRSTLNFAVTDGECTIVTRYRTSRDASASLYYAQGTAESMIPAFTLPSNRSCHPSAHPANSIAIASEPLSLRNADWKLLDDCSMLTVQRDSSEGQGLSLDWTALNRQTLEAVTPKCATCRTCARPRGEGMEDAGNAAKKAKV